MLAHQPPAVAADILSARPLDANTAHTITDPAAITARLEAGGKNGYETAFQEVFAADLSIAAPIFRKDGRGSAAVNIVVASPRWTPERVIEGLASVVVETARAISAAGW